MKLFVRQVTGVRIRVKNRIEEMKKIEAQAILLDLDGTLINSIGIYHKIVNAVFERLCLPPISWSELRDAAADGEFAWERVLPEETLQDQPEMTRQAKEIAWEIYPDLFAEEVRLFPGAKEVLQNAGQRGLKLAVVTSTPKANISLKLKPFAQEGIIHLFEEIITSDDTPRKKPAPDPLIECGNRIGVSPEHCVYVGDTRTDIQAGKAAGMKTVGVLTGFDDRDALSRENPDAMLDSIAGLPRTLWA